MLKGKMVSLGNSEPSSRYVKYAYKWILHEEFNKLKARLLNFAESTTTNKEQSEATKGLLKDFTHQCYYNSLHKIEDYLEYFKVIDRKQGESDPMLDANSMKDIFSN